MKKLFIIMSAMAILGSCSEGARVNPFLTEWDTPYGMPPFGEIKAEDYVPAVEAGIKEQKAQLQAILDNPDAPTFENTIAPYELSGGILSRVIGVLYNVSESDGSPELEAVMEKVTPMLSAHDDDIFMNPDFYARVKAVYEGDQSSLSREQQMVVKDLYETFDRNGVGLDSAAQAELRDINSKLSSLTQKFGNQLRSENNAFEQKCGIPVSQYTSEMTSCADRSRREQLFKAYSSRGANGGENDTRGTLLEVLRLRARKAEVLGYRNFAEYQLADKMAHDPGTVDSFLQEIMDASMRKAKSEVAQMQKVMDRDAAAGLVPAGSKIEPWDWFYYAERVRSEKYALDESLTRPYFKLENVRDGAFYAAKKIYGVNVEEAPGLPVYNPQVKTFKVTDYDGKFLGIFMCDYLPRPSKRGGGWMNNFRDQYVDSIGNDVRPIIVNVCNFTLPTDSLPSLLTIDEVQTTFHEFGHALHGLLSRCHYRDVSGTSVKRDFVETFSQFNENWALQPEILAQYAKHFESGEVIPDSLVAKIGTSQKFNQGFMTGELCAASILDMKWHELTLSELENIDIDAFEKKVCGEMGLIDEIIPRYRSSYFNHIFGGDGYSAGYYSYLWSLVLATDCFEVFENNGIYDHDTAMKFRQTFLEKGGSEEPMTLFRSFTGADPDPSSLIRLRGLD